MKMITDPHYETEFDTPTKCIDAADKIKAQLNHQAYEDVLELKGPTMPYNKQYMAYYYEWCALQLDIDHTEGD